VVEGKNELDSYIFRNRPKTRARPHNIYIYIYVINNTQWRGVRCTIDLLSMAEDQKDDLPHTVCVCVLVLLLLLLLLYTRITSRGTRYICSIRFD